MFISNLYFNDFTILQNYSFFFNFTFKFNFAYDCCLPDNKLF